MKVKKIQSRLSDEIAMVETNEAFAIAASNENWRSFLKRTRSYRLGLLENHS